jgi:hypothetical protein
VIVQEKLARLVLAVAALALVAFWGGLGDVVINGLKWG